MDAYSTYHALTTVYLALLALPHLLTPTLLITLLQPTVRDTTPTETYLARSLGIALVGLALLSLVLSGLVPLQTTSTSTTHDEATEEAEGAGSYYAVPTTIVSVLFHVSMLVLSYTRFSSSGQYVFATSTGASGVLAAVGVWCLVFGSGGTGAGKIHRSGFMFPDAEKRKRKVEKREERWGKKGL